MTDDAFLHAFLTATLPNDQFHHRDHLRMTWLLLRRLGTGAGAEAIVSGIQRFAAAHGHGPRYHETMTRFWIWFVDHAMQARPEVDGFDAFAEAFPMAGQEPPVPPLVARADDEPGGSARLGRPRPARAACGVSPRRPKARISVECQS